MSYSRWGSSYWYTFWCVAPEGVIETRDNAILVVMLVKQFSAKELRDNLPACLEAAEKLSLERVAEKGGHPPTTSDMQELHEIFIEFLDDVDAHYPVL